MATFFISPQKNIFERLVLVENGANMMCHNWYNKNMGYNNLCTPYIICG